MAPARASPGLSLTHPSQEEGPIYVENSFAVVETGGKQYKVAPGAVVEVELLPAAEGESVELDRVLLVSQAGQVTVGTPTVPGAKVLATVQAQGQGPKIIVFRYKAKTRQRKKTGHRQQLTTLAIKEIVAG